MNTTQTTEKVKGNSPSSFTAACLKSCKKVLAQVQNVKNAIFAESRSLLRGQEIMLRSALNEAEALAWGTGYPHLVFPDLAAEKVQAAANWSRRQQSIRHMNAAAAQLA